MSDPSSVGSFLSFVGTVRPSIIGGGWWLKFWSKRLEKNAIRFVKTRPEIASSVANHAPFFSAIEATRIACNLPEEIAVSDTLRRIMAAVYFQFPKVYFSPSEVKGLEFQKRRLECHFPLSKWGDYEIRCDGNGKEFASFVHVRSSRERILKGHYEAFGKVPEFNLALVELLKVRREYATQLGFSSWTEMQARASGFESEFGPIEFLSSLYKDSQPHMNALLSQSRQLKMFDPKHKLTCPTDEGYFLTQLRNSLGSSEIFAKKARKHFEYRACVRKLLRILENLFGVIFTPVEVTNFTHGWHPSVMAFKLERKVETSEHADTKLGHIYIDLFRRKGIAMGPHCTPLYPSNHVRVYMGLEPPYRSDVTFKKERYFTPEEITALMHELGHCMHILLRPKHGPVAQLPLDMREAVSIMTEIYTETDEFVNNLCDNSVTPAEKDSAFRRDVYFYIDIIRNVAVHEAIHSTKFDPFAGDAATEMERIAKESFAKFTPMHVDEWMSPFAGELANYLLDGESRIGYLISYIRAAEEMSNIQKRKTGPTHAFEELGHKYIQPRFEPYISQVLQSHSSEIPCNKHPLAVRDHRTVPSQTQRKAFWDYIATKETKGKVRK